MRTPRQAQTPETDMSRPRPARICDYALGGKDHFTAEREMAGKARAAMPTGPTAARENRSLSGRAVRYVAAEGGVCQFLDIGTGWPPATSTKSLSGQPESRIVCMDGDPLVPARAPALLASSAGGRTACVQAGLRDPAGIVARPVTGEVIDFSRPVALMLVAILHFTPDDGNPAGIIKALVEALAPGSFLAATRLTGEHDPEGRAAVERSYRAAGMPTQWRDGDAFAGLALAGLELVSPGVVLVPEWRRDIDGPRPSPDEVSFYGGVARRPCRAQRPQAGW